MQEPPDRDPQTGRLRPGHRFRFRPGGPGGPGRPRKYPPLRSRDTPWRAEPGRLPPAADREAILSAWIAMALEAKSRYTPMRQLIRAEAAGYHRGEEKEPSMSGNHESESPGPPILDRLRRRLAQDPRIGDEAADHVVAQAREGNLSAIRELMKAEKAGGAGATGRVVTIANVMDAIKVVEAEERGEAVGEVRFSPELLRAVEEVERALDAAEAGPRAAASD
jgi:hypothetical protein